MQFSGCLFISSVCVISLCISECSAQYGNMPNHMTNQMSYAGYNTMPAGQLNTGFPTGFESAQAYNSPQHAYANNAYANQGVVFQATPQNQQSRRRSAQHARGFAAFLDANKFTLFTMVGALVVMYLLYSRISKRINDKLNAEAKALADQKLLAAGYTLPPPAGGTVVAQPAVMQPVEQLKTIGQTVLNPLFVQQNAPGTQ